MNTKIIVSLVVMAAVAAVAGGATVAYFTDTESSTVNTFAAGTLNLGLDNAPGVNPTGSETATWVANTWAPGGTKDATLYVNNAGTLGASTTKISFDYVLTDVATPASVDAGTTVLDNMIKATVVKWNGVDVASLEGKTLAQLKAAGITDLGALAANTEHGLQITWTLDTAADNGIQGDSVDVTLNVALGQ